MFGPVLDTFLNHYELEFFLPSMLRGQNTHDYFTFDFRNTHSPEIGEGFIDFFIHGELK